MISKAIKIGIAAILIMVRILAMFQTGTLLS